MLILSRKMGEEIIIPGAKIRITVLGTKGTTIRLGITAPRETSILRKEVWDRICQTMDHVALTDFDPSAVSEFPIQAR